MIDFIGDHQPMVSSFLNLHIISFCKGKTQQHDDNVQKLLGDGLFFRKKRDNEYGFLITH